VKDLVAKYLAVDGVTVANVQVGALITEAFWPMQTVATCLDAICQNTGYSWFIDDAKDLHFYDTAGQTCPISLADKSNNFRNMQVSRGMGDYFNAEWVKGADAISDPRPESFIGDGKKTQFILSKGCMTVPTITKNGTAQTVGISNVDSGKQWYWSAGSQAIIQDISGAVLGPADTLTVLYQYAFPNLEYNEASDEIARSVLIGGGSGHYEVFKSVGNIKSPVEGQGYIAADLTKFGRVSEVIQFESDNPAILPGQVITANVNQHGVFGNYLITGISISDLDKTLLRRTVTAQGGQFLSQWTDYYRSIAKQNATGFDISSGSVLLTTVNGNETLIFADSLTAAMGPMVSNLGVAVLGFFQLG
jgi:hypothetical protein